MIKDPTPPKTVVSVLESLMARLEKTIPVPALSPFPIGSSLEERMKTLEAENARIRALLQEETDPSTELVPVEEKPKEEATAVATESEPAAEVPPPEAIPPGGMIAPAIQDAAIHVLRSIVDNFNENLDIWYKTTGCVANFSWDYATNKKLNIAGIDLIIFRKPAPSGTTIKEILGKGAPAS